MTAARIASIWFPRLAIERWAKAFPERRSEPLALVTEGARGIVIDALTSAGLAGGARIGMKLADARAAFPALAAMPSDKAGDAKALARLAHWCQRWTPAVTVDAADGLWLQMTGGEHLFGGKFAFLGVIRANLANLSLTARVASAPTPGAAWALARFGDGEEIVCDDGSVEAMLAPLPVQALRLDDETCLLLHRLGLKRIGDLAGLPSRALARRFSRRDGDMSDPWLRYAQAIGRVEEPLDPFIEDPQPTARLRLAEPIVELPQLLPQVDRLAADLAQQLYARHAGARWIALDAFRVDGDVQRREARASEPVRDAKHVARLIADSLESLDAGFGFDAFALTALWHEPLGATQEGLIEPESDAASLPRLIDRLSARLGASRVSTPHWHESHHPERRLVWRPALKGQPKPLTHSRLGRPIRLLDRPEPIAVIYATPEGAPRQFSWRRASHRVVKVEGPERIATEWWRARAKARERDYYTVEDSMGRRYWLFRHGRFGDGQANPDWYLHGLFA